MLIYTLNIFKYAQYRHKLVYVFIYTNKQIRHICKSMQSLKKDLRFKTQVHAYICPHFWLCGLSIYFR